MIRVRETATDHLTAERADLRATVSAEGGDKAQVARATRAALSAVTEELQELQVSGAVHRWSNDQATVWSHRGWDDRGNQTDLVHQASAAVRAAFIDFTELARVVGCWSERDEVQIEHIDWQLTEVTRDGAQAALRTVAVHSATAKAQQYARAAGLRTVQPTSIVDDAGHGTHDDQFRHSEARAASAGGTPPFHFAPSDIVVSTTIEMKFAGS